MNEQPNTRKICHKQRSYHQFAFYQSQIRFISNVTQPQKRNIKHNDRNRNQIHRLTQCKTHIVFSIYWRDGNFIPQILKV